MSKACVVVLEVTSGQLTVTAAARAYGLSRQHIYRLLKRYQLGGLDALEPRSRRPASNPRAPSPMTSSPPSCFCAKSSPPKASTPAR
jgi:transposase-like protein